MLARGANLIRARGIESDADLGPLVDPEVPFEGDPQLRQRLQHMYDAGAWVLIESAIADLPVDLRWLFESGAVTIEQLAALHRATGAVTAADLTATLRQQAIRSIPGLNEAVESAIASVMPDLRASIPRIPLGRAISVVDPVLARLRTLPGIRWAEPVGSLRRGEDTVGDLEIVAAAQDPAAAADDLIHLPEAGRALHRSHRRLYMLFDRVQLGVRFPEPAEAGTALLQLTGSTAHVNRLGELGAERGVDWLAPAETEEEIYARLGLPFIPPEIRNGDDEVRAAVEGALPAFVTGADIRGDLHMHSTWSGGRDSIETMVAACRALRYEYLAITDHSQHAATSRNLTVDGARRQAEEIAALRERYPDIAILHGCEVDILPDGRLAFPDRVLKQFDIVLASLHESAGQSPAELQRRYVTAMRHPLVTLITHPTNRLVPYRRGYALDYDALFGLAAETSTVVEIDGSPAHLDLDGTLARRAIEAGATVAIDSDCHRSDMLGRQMELGVMTARRGWIEPRHVLNTRPLEEVRAFIARKRGSGVRS